MCLLIETVKVHYRLLYNIEAHNRRVAHSRSALFGLEDQLDLRDVISLPDDLNNGLYKCRIVYGKKVQTVEFQKYVPKFVRTLQVVHDDMIQYDHKFLDRSCFDQILRRAAADDILIVKNGFVSDVSFANIVFYDGRTRFTPAHPLLKGTKRQLLIEAGVIREEDIPWKEMDRFIHASLINAMLDLNDGPVIPIANIFSSD